MRASSVLVADDDETIRQALASGLASAGYRVVVATDGAEAAEILAAESPDLVITDLVMPAMDGFALIARIRERGEETPIIVLSVRGEESSKVRALDLGADDFITKPFSLAELAARVRAQLRRRGVAVPTLLRFPGLEIDVERRAVVASLGELHVTPTEFAILVLLARKAGRPVTIAEIVATVWGGAPGTSPDTVRVHVGSLRRKIEPDPATPRFILTEPWVGYRFIAEPI